MARYNISDEALIDLEDIHSYIAEDDQESANKFVLKFLEKFDLLAENSRIGRVWDRDSPELLIFPFKRYLIFYVQTNFGVEIYRVLHSARDVENLI